MTDPTPTTTAEASADSQYRVTEFGANVLCLFGTMFLFHGGYMSFHADVPPLVWSTLVIFPWSAGLLLTVIALSPVDPRPYGRWLAFIVVTGILAGDVAATYSTVTGAYRFGTDTLLFSRRAVDLLLEGTNPYAVSMTPIPYEFKAQMTPTIDGGHVDSFSYPAGAILVFIPQRLLGIGKTPMHLTGLLAAVAVCAYLIAVSPRELAVVPALVFAGMGLFTDATGGIIDAVWVFPLLLAMHSLYDRHWLAGGLWYGVSMAIKQQPWLIAPFLLVWALMDSPHPRRDATRLVGGAVTTFTAINLPFFVWNPTAWIQGVLTPVAGDQELIAQGVGLSAIRWSGLYLTPKLAHTLLVAAATLGLLAWYTLRGDGRRRWLAFIMPPVILFLHWRSLPSYFVWYLPVVYMALLAAEHALPSRSRTPASEVALG